jgi:hypothetical protein
LYKGLYCKDLKLKKEEESEGGSKLYTNMAAKAVTLLLLRLKTIKIQALPPISHAIAYNPSLPFGLIYTIYIYFAF